MHLTEESRCGSSKMQEVCARRQKSTITGDKMRIERLAAQDLHILTELFDYNDVGQMIQECTRDLQNHKIDVFVLFEQNVLIGELHVMYENDDKNFAERGRRAYLYAFRIREGYQNKGYGKKLLQEVISELRREGYGEFTVGVEDDNEIAIHVYRSFGFNEFLLRKQEEYQGEAYEYNLYLKK